MKDVLNGCFFVKMSTQKKGKNDAVVGGFFLERRDFSGLELVAPALGIIHGLKPLFSSRPLIVGENGSEESFLMYSITKRSVDFEMSFGVIVLTPVLYTVGLYSPSMYYTHNINVSE